MGTGFSFGVMEMAWNWVEVVVAQHCECSSIGLYTLKWLILLCDYYLNFFKKEIETNNNKNPCCILAH